MTVRITAALSLTIAVLASATGAFAAREVLTKPEAKCQQTVAKQLAKIVTKRTACILKCDKKTPQDATCLPPYGGTTLECLQKIDAKALEALAAKCVSDGSDTDSCPECYEAGTAVCADVSANVDLLEMGVDAVADEIFCDDGGSGDDLSKTESKCRRAFAPALAKYVATSAGCYAKCVKREAKGKTDGTCDPVPTDTKTYACLLKGSNKLLATVGKKCPDQPECMTAPFFLIGATTSAINMAADLLAVCPVCGDGITESGEACDPPGATTCNGGAMCTAQCTCP
jgi:hypothetical protein